MFPIVSVEQHLGLVRPVQRTEIYGTFDVYSGTYANQGIGDRAIMRDGFRRDDCIDISASSICVASVHIAYLVFSRFVGVPLCGGSHSSGSVNLANSSLLGTRI
jgi:hypothetical protein